MTKSTKYALLCYNTENVGDEIQSIAAKRFLPRIDYYIDRDHMDSTKFATKTETVKIILNGWFLHKIHSSKPYAWPPQNPQIDPLLISMHFRQNDKSLTKTLASKESIDFLKQHSPVGARDLSTLRFLEQLNVPAYFSGCLTLTLLPSPKIKKQDYILAVDASDEILEAIKKRTDRPIINLSVYRPVNFTFREKFLLAEYWLYLYQSAHCIVTSRLHTILPSIALGTPVIAIEQNSDRGRYEGLIDLANHYSAAEFINNPKISVNQPLKTPPFRENSRQPYFRLFVFYRIRFECSEFRS